MSEVTRLTGRAGVPAASATAAPQPHGWFPDNETRVEDIGGLDQGHTAGKEQNDVTAGAGQNHVRTRGA